MPSASFVTVDTRSHTRWENREHSGNVRATEACERAAIRHQEGHADRPAEESSLKRLAIALAVVVIALAALWSYYTAREDFPEASNYRIDLDALAALAKSTDQALPKAIHHELVALAGMPKAMVFAGESFESHEMAHGSYLIEYADRAPVLVDVAFGPDAMDDFPFDGRYDERAFEKLQQTMLEADHIAGLAQVEDVEAISRRLMLNPEQLSSAEAEQFIAPELRDQIESVDYEETLLVAPGVVLLRAPGHTKGSQIIYVVLEAGDELLLIGDVAWHLDQIRNEHYRPRLVTDLFLGEDREAVLHQMRALQDVMAEGRATVVSSHDVTDRRRLIDAGLIGEGFP